MEKEFLKILFKIISMRNYNDDEFEIHLVRLLKRNFD